MLYSDLYLWRMSCARVGHQGSAVRIRLATDARLWPGHMRCSLFKGLPEGLVRRVLCIETRWGVRKVGDVGKVLLAQDLPEPPRNRVAGHSGNVKILLFGSLHVRPGMEGNPSLFGLILLEITVHGLALLVRATARGALGRLFTVWTPSAL
jgi:hypothetical protein